MSRLGGVSLFGGVARYWSRPRQRALGHFGSRTEEQKIGMIPFGTCLARSIAAALDFADAAEPGKLSGREPCAFVGEDLQGLPDRIDPLNRPGKRGHLWGRSSALQTSET